MAWWADELPENQSRVRPRGRRGRIAHDHADCHRRGPRIARIDDGLSSIAGTRRRRATAPRQEHLHEVEPVALEGPTPSWRGRLHQVAFFLAIPAGITLVAFARASSSRLAVTVYAL